MTEKLKRMGAEVVQLDLSNKAALQPLIKNCDAALFTPILSVSASAAKTLSEGQRAVFFSSNNVAIDPAAPIYAKLLDAERVVQDSCGAVTILRPTMIYGYPGDGESQPLNGGHEQMAACPDAGNGKRVAATRLLP